MTDRLYFTEGHHKDYLAVVEREACLTCITRQHDREYYGYGEVSKTIYDVERYDNPDGPSLVVDQLNEAADSPSQAAESDATDDTPQPSTSSGNGRKRLYNALMDAGIDVDDVSVTNVPSDEVYRIELNDGIDDYDAIDSWTDSRFGKDKPGYIDWTEYEKDDGSTGYYPDAYCVPYDALEDVVG